MSDVAAAGLAAAVLSGAPSTAWALARGGDPLDAGRAAGAMVVGERAGAAVQFAAAIPVHLALSLGWTAVLARVLPARRTAAWGAAAGLAIAVLDLGVIGRRFPAIRRLPAGPQLADHVAFGAVAGAVLARRASSSSAWR
ncbi:hypothetical protein [Capillimicrobium parvum]|uniref:Uncharacterized protein n=1 Tax=Capillimicrobium parvum TaxID=2884022 RepID=A0A9E6XUZ6_9ACTN|nr:hypothetical protein [Capillimicrobium parvum]UGS34901.1 hypothetical protein DSM104329_01283 [Capillimicrobium parvum]